MLPELFPTKNYIPNWASNQDILRHTDSPKNDVGHSIQVANGRCALSKRESKARKRSQEKQGQAFTEGNVKEILRAMGKGREVPVQVRPPEQPFQPD